MLPMFLYVHLTALSHYMLIMKQGLNERKHFITYATGHRLRTFTEMINADNAQNSNNCIIQNLTKNF